MLKKYEKILLQRMGISSCISYGWQNVYPILITPRKTNMSSENQCLEDVFPIEIVPFYGTC